MPEFSGLVLTARGHPNVKASHAKTLELVPEGQVSPRGTCILGVDLRGDLDALACLRGPAVFRLRCGDRLAEVRARLNPAWLPGEPLILRTRATPLARRTLAYAADTGAAGLDRAFVSALADSEARLEVEVAAEGPPGPGTLVLAHPAGARDARREAAERLAERRVSEAAGLCEAIAAGARVLLESGDPGVWAAAVQAAQAAGGLATLAGGWPAALGAQALSGLGGAAWGQVTAWPDGKPARRALLAGLARSGAALLLRLPAGQAESLLGLAAKALAGREASLVVAPGEALEEATRGSLEEIAGRRAPEAEAWLAVAGLAAEAAQDLDPELLALARSLQGQGVGTKSLAAALSEVAGVSKREAFNILVKNEEKDIES
jgi:hypothetical protein